MAAKIAIDGRGVLTTRRLSRFGTGVSGDSGAIRKTDFLVLGVLVGLAASFKIEFSAGPKLRLRSTFNFLAVDFRVPVSADGSWS